jgi:3-deoxy-D-manno-octulosonic-acid transferase
MWILYQFATVITLLIAAPVLWLRRGRHYFSSLSGRLAYPKGKPHRHSLWLHAVSVGEVGVASTLIAALPSDIPILVTTVTPTGQEQARQKLDRRAHIAYLPFDLNPAIDRFLSHFAPHALILIEGDLWPLLMRSLQSRSVPIVVVNGRVSDRSYRRMKRLQWMIGPLLRPVNLFCVQSNEDRNKLIDLGVASNRVIRTGNLKFDSPRPTLQPEVSNTVNSLAAGRPILIAGSTMAGEDEPILDAFLQIGGGERSMLVLAPRHLERCDEVSKLIESKAFSTVRRSQIEPECEDHIDVLLLDSLGELASLYELGAAAFIGGTLVPTGGHNPLEAARYGVPIAIGPSMENFREIATHFDRTFAWHRVTESRELAEIWDLWLRDPAAARRTGSNGALVLSSNQGALRKTLQAIQPYLEPLDADRHSSLHLAT